MENPATAIVIGYGNTLRGDDGIGPLAAGHTDLVWGLYASADARQDRRAITRAILQLVGSENETAP